MARAVPRLRRVEQLRGGASGARSRGARTSGEPLPRDRREAPTLRLHRRGRRGADSLGNRRVRQGARRRHRPRLPCAHRRRAGHRQEHAPPSGGAPSRTLRRRRPLRLRGGIGAPDQAPGRAPRRRRRRALPDGGDGPRAHPGRGRSAPACGPRGRLGADDLLFAFSLGARQHQPGPGGRDAAPLPRQGVAASRRSSSATSRRTAGSRAPSPWSTSSTPCSTSRGRSTSTTGSCVR